MAPSTGRRATAPRPPLGTLASAIIVAAGYLLSRVLGLGREVIISAQFGTGAELDAFRATFGIIDLIYIVIAGGALGSAFIPVFSTFLTEAREHDAWRLASGLLTILLAALLVACAAIALLAEPLVALTVARGFDAERRELTAQLLRLMLLQPVLLGVGGLAKATLESFDRFTLPAIGANLYNLGIIGGALLGPWLGIYGPVAGVLVGAALFLLVQLPGLRAIGARYVGPRDTAARGGGGGNERVPGLLQVGRLLAPRLFGQAAWQVNIIALTSFASTLGVGAVAANGYALQLMMLPHGLLALSLGTVIFPQLSRAHAAGDGEEIRRLGLGALRTVLFAALPAAVVLGILSAPIVRVLFERGAFDAASTALTASALRFYMFGLAAFAASEILVRIFYAMQDTRTPVLVGVVTVALNIGLSLALLRLGAGLNGLALAFSVANTVEALALLALLRPRLAGLGGGFWSAIGRMLLATGACAGVLLGLRLVTAPYLPAIEPIHGYRWPADFLPLAGWLIAAGAAGFIAYAAAAAALRLEELGALIRRVRGKATL